MADPAPTASAGEPTPAAGSSSCGIDTTAEAPRALDERFAEAWLNRADHRVCGYSLRPYCLQHALMLQLVDSPFVSTQPRPILWSDVFTAAAICATGFEELPRFRSRLRAHAFRLVRGLAARLTGGRLGTDLESECHRFRTYQNDFQSEPDLFFESEGRELTAPVLLGRAVYLHASCGVTEERAWTMPIGKALWIYAAHLEQSQAGVTLLDEEDTKWMEWVKDIQSGRIPLPPELYPDAVEQAAAGARINPEVFGPAT